VTVRARFADLRSVTRSATLDAPISATAIIADIVANKQARDPQTRRIKQYGANILEYFSNGKTRRSIACANDGGRWVFETFGTPFEIRGSGSLPGEIPEGSLHRRDAAELPRSSRHQQSG
jgi:hypothetical protein